MSKTRVWLKLFPDQTMLRLDFCSHSESRKLPLCEPVDPNCYPQDHLEPLVLEGRLIVLHGRCGIWKDRPCPNLVTDKRPPCMSCSEFLEYALCGIPQTQVATRQVDLYQLPITGLPSRNSTDKNNVDVMVEQSQPWLWQGCRTLTIHVEHTS